jgi:hypothetical protein
MIPSWVKASLILAAMFAAGMLAGVRYERSQEASSSPSSRTARHDASHGLRVELGLDSAQEAAVTEILQRHQKAIDGAWSTLKPEVRAALDSTHEEILRVLKPDQAEKYRRRMGAMHSGRRH